MNREREIVMGSEKNRGHQKERFSKKWDIWTVSSRAQIQHLPKKMLAFIGTVTINQPPEFFCGRSGRGSGRHSPESATLWERGGGRSGEHKKKR